MSSNTKIVETDEESVKIVEKDDGQVNNVPEKHEEAPPPQQANESVRQPTVSQIRNENKYLSNYELLSEKIGSGAFANVYLVRDLNTGEIFAAKISKKIVNDTPEMLKNLSREVNILYKLNHPAILKFICYSPTNFKQKNRPVIITEYAPNGSLYDLIRQERQSLCTQDWDDTRKLIILYGIASALAFLHSNHIVHRDLKPSNILLDKYLQPKVGDFGLSKINHQNEESMTMNSTVGIKGTPLYVAPEVWERQEYSEASDVYSFAMIMFELITAQVPFDEGSVFSIQEFVKSGRRPEIASDTPEVYKFLIEQCWDQDPNNRPTFEQILQQLKNDPGFLENVDEDDFLNYTDFIDDYKFSFDKEKKINVQNFEERQSKIFRAITRNDVKKGEEKDKEYKLLCPEEYFDNLDEKRQYIIEQAENDPFKQYMVGHFLVEGVEGFPQETDVGVQYLEKSIAAGCIEACCYYCNLLIRGQFVSLDIELAKSYLEPRLKSHDGIVYLLYGRVMRKLERFDEARKYFRKGSDNGSNEAMYEYGKMMYRGEGCEKNEEEAKKFFTLAQKNGYYKAYEFIDKQKKEEERRRRRNKQLMEQETK